MTEGRLTPQFVASVETPGAYMGDEASGLRLRVQSPRRPGGRHSKYWAQRIEIHGKRRDFGLGAYPAVSLDEAREKARAMLARWEDPQPVRPPADSVPTFAQAFEATITQKRRYWGTNRITEKRWRTTMGAYVLGALGSMPVTAVRTTDIVNALRTVGATHLETARNLRLRIANVLAWAQAEGYRDDNPARTERLERLYPHPSDVAPNDALPHEYVGEILGRVRASSARATTVACAEFMVLTGCRAGEARLATWDEIDLDAMAWTIPASRSVLHIDQIIPLAPAARKTLQSLLAQRPSATGWVFPSPDNRPMSDSSLSKLFRERGVRCTPNESRKLFLQWAQGAADRRDRQRVGHDLSLIEAYADGWETGLLRRRRALMAQWDGQVIVEAANFLARLPQRPEAPPAQPLADDPYDSMSP